MASVRSRRAEIPPHSFCNDRHQSKLQIGAPFEGPEQELFGPFNGRGNSIDSGDGLHGRPFGRSNNVLQNYAFLMCEVPLSVAPSPPANPQTQPAPARTPSGAAPFCREPDAVFPRLSAPA